MAQVVAQEVLPPILGSNSDPPPRFDGTTRLYTTYTCPFAQRVWIARNYKGLQDKIKLVPINLDDKPSWYKEVYSPAQYPAKKEIAEEMMTYVDIFFLAVIKYMNGVRSESEINAAFDKLEDYLSKFDDGLFFLGQFSAVDIAYAPIIERFPPVLLELKNYDLTSGRPKLATWIEEMNKVDAYKQTKDDTGNVLATFKRHALGK